jgi:hypothetical protein
MQNTFLTFLIDFLSNVHNIVFVLWNSDLRALALYLSLKFMIFFFKKCLPHFVNVNPLIHAYANFWLKIFTWFFYNDFIIESAKTFNNKMWKPNTLTWQGTRNDFWGLHFQKKKYQRKLPMPVPKGVYNHMVLTCYVLAVLRV